VLLTKASGQPAVKLVPAKRGRARLQRHPALVGSVVIHDPAALLKPLPSVETLGYCLSPCWAADGGALPRRRYGESSLSGSTQNSSLGFNSTVGIGSNFEVSKGAGGIWTRNQGWRSEGPFANFPP